ncbi:hypothetical protein HIM_00371 [Hirsutella minnesotensis 3608]|nr:hypothetical protein HIM_00371 [Hirsutella minnesotensis 3608]
MAFAARVGALSDQLVDSLTQPLAQANPERFRSTCEVVLRKLRTHPYLRTNPFEVDANLEGLEERFRINHRDGLADALSQRLKQLRQSPSKWNPEILYLLLELSDQPTYKTRLSDLEPPEQKDAIEPAEPLRWQDLAKEDGWDQDGDLWKTVQYSSDDSTAEDVDMSASETSDDGSVTRDEDSTTRLAEDFIIRPEDDEALELICQEQAWRRLEKPLAATRKVQVPEVHVVREALFMLQGLDNSLFDNSTSPVSTFKQANIASETYKALAVGLAHSGWQLRLLRQFSAQPQAVPHLQAFQDCLSRHLEDLGLKIAEIQARLASPKGEVVVTLTGVTGELASRLEQLSILSTIVVRLQEASKLDTFRYLELIFDAASDAQLAGKPGIYEFLARLFVECFNVYLRPIRHWMNEGKILPGNELFFIAESTHEVPLGETWRNRFSLRQTADGRLHAPRFLQPASRKIYNAGKNIMVMRLLGKYDILSSQPEGRPPLDFDTLCPMGFELAPFPELFATAFDQWIQSQYSRSSDRLKNTLLEHCGVASSLDALRVLYLMSEGRAATMLCQELFTRLDLMGERWHDRYALTALGREAFASLFDTSRLSVSVDSATCRPPTTESYSVKDAIPGIKVHYRMPWPVQMVVTAESMAHYQAVFTFLLQIRRGSHALHRHKMLDNYWIDGENWPERSLFYAVRSKLLWFYSAIQTYLTTLVLEPGEKQMRCDLESAEDIDNMIAIHAGAMEQIVEESCLGKRLAPVHGRILDMLDLAMKLEYSEARHFRQEKDMEAFGHVLQEIAADFERDLGFVCSGLRGVSRASSSNGSAKWDMLADMLQVGMSSSKATAR